MQKSYDCRQLINPKIYDDGWESDLFCQENLQNNLHPLFFTFTKTKVNPLLLWVSLYMQNFCFRMWWRDKHGIFRNLPESDPQRDDGAASHPHPNYNYNYVNLGYANLSSLSSSPLNCLAIWVFILIFSDRALQAAFSKLRSYATWM